MDHLTVKNRSALMRRVRNRNTAPEMLVRSLFHRLGFRFRLHRADLPGTPDLVLPSRRMAVFVHGCFWHQHSCKRGAPPASNRDFWRNKLERNQQRDRKSAQLLKRDGWQVVVIWECETRDQARLARRIMRLLRT